MIRKILLSTVAILAASASAFAADLPSRLPPPIAPVPIFSWNGIYLGGQVGYEGGRESTYTPGAFNNINSSWPSGIIGGAHVGYNYQAWSLIVLGVEGDVNGSSYNGGIFNGNTGFVEGTRTPIDGSVRGRVGIAIDRALLYVTGGAAFASLHEYYNGGPLGYASIQHGRVGWTAGGGVEYAITNNWSVRAEYRHTDYGSSSDFIPLAGGSTRVVHEYDERVQAGFSYKFDTYIAPTPIVAKY